VNSSVQVGKVELPDRLRLLRQKASKSSKPPWGSTPSTLVNTAGFRNIFQAKRQISTPKTHQSETGMNILINKKEHGFHGIIDCWDSSTWGHVKEFISSDGL
jgi:hypothetical protein